MTKRKRWKEESRKKRKNKKKYVFVALGVAILFLLLVILKFDFEIVAFFSSIRNSLLDWPALAFTYVGGIAALIFALLIVYFSEKKKIIPLLISFFSAYFISTFIKLIVARPRPFLIGIPVPVFDFLIKQAYSAWDSSFPSNHAVMVFAALPFVPKKLWWPWLFFAVFVALSRVYFGLHYLSDVIVGAGLGLGIAYLVKTRYTRYAEKRKKSREKKK